MEDPTPNPPSAQHAYNSHFLPQDPGERIPVARYDVNDQDDVRRRYIGKGPCQLFEHTFQPEK